MQAPDVRANAPQRGEEADVLPAGAEAPAVAVVVPAHNEAPTVGEVVRAARAARLVDEVIVVDSGSADETACMAAQAGARVVAASEAGKGEAMAAGVAATRAGIVVFLDADLTGLRPDHVDRLAAPVVGGRVAMTCGLFDRGPLWNPIFLRALPPLTGERALRRELFEALALEDVRGYKVEAALNSLCRERELPVHKFICDGMFHRTKEEKYDSRAGGFARKVAMLGTATWSYVRFRAVRAARRGQPG